MQVIKYIGVYDVFYNGKLEKDCSLAAIKKMNYIIDTLNNIGYNVEVISIARNKKKAQKKSKIPLNNKLNSLLLLNAIGSSNKFISRIGELQIRLELFLWLIKNIKKNETILVYHSQRLCKIIYWASKIKKFNYILEVEELYYKFGFVSKNEEKNEKKMIYNSKSLLVSTKNIANELNYTNKFIELHGNYENLSSENRYVTKLDKKYKVVFAGGVETVRNTAFNVCECAKYLEECFDVYILGYGDEESILKLEKLIMKINDKIGYSKIKYCGTMVGSEYDKFMSSCDIAINFQNMDEYYMKYAFPSKVLNYLGYNLIVITTPLETIRNSKINELVMYPNNMENTPESFAYTINQLQDTIQEKKQNIKYIIQSLDSEFKLKLYELLN